MELASHLQWLNDFVGKKRGGCKKDPGPLELKLHHTKSVLENSQAIAKAEKFSPEMTLCATVAALYHDLARFDQYLEYGTFKDALSRNHAAWAVQLLKRHGRLKNLKLHKQRLIQIAVGLHNRLDLPATLTGEEKLIAHAVRDSDKLDIIRVMSEHLSGPGPYNPTIVLSLPDDPTLASKATIADALAHRSSSYADLTSVNDFRLLLGTWLFGMNFPSSQRLFASSPHTWQLVEALPADSNYGEAREEILTCLEQARNV